MLFQELAPRQGLYASHVWLLVRKLTNISCVDLATLRYSFTLEYIIRRVIARSSLLYWDWLISCGKLCSSQPSGGSRQMAQHLMTTSRAVLKTVILLMKCYQSSKLKFKEKWDAVEQAILQNMFKKSETIVSQSYYLTTKNKLILPNQLQFCNHHLHNIKYLFIATFVF